MQKQISYKIVSLIFSILVICFAVGFYVLAVWKEPTAAPPGDNVFAPINVGSVGQNKKGTLIVGFDGGLGFFETAHETHLAVVDGNVGIGTTSPSSGTGGQLKLDVEGAVGATKYCDKDGNNCTTAGGLGGGFGAWETKAFDTIYQASTDGFVSTYIRGDATLLVYTHADSSLVTNNNAAALRGAENGYEMNWGNYGGLTMPVKKGDYWKVRKVPVGGCVSPCGTGAVYWIPMGN